MSTLKWILVLLVLGFVLSMEAQASGSSVRQARSLSGSRKTTVIGGRDRLCGGTEAVNHDGTFEFGWAWTDEGEVAPYYGAFGEAYDLGDVQLTCASFWFTQVGDYAGQTMDVYVWDGGVTRPPGAVLAVVPNVSPGTIGMWPSLSRHDVELDVHVTGEFTAGYWGNWPGAPNGWWVGADLNGWGGFPWTMVAPGLGYPEGWHNVNDIAPFQGTAALGIGVTWRQPGPLGACCEPSTGTCFVSVEPECLPPNEWHPEWTECVPNPCPQLLGACCHPDGSCTFGLQVQCADSWLGWGTSCDPNPCLQPGVCCYADGHCEFGLHGACTGDWQGPGGSCEPNPCPQPEGACCHADGSCTMILQADCEGEWHGYNSTCEPNGCRPNGAHRLYVSPGGSPSGFPWFPNIQAALSWEELRDGDEIELQNGIFTGPGNRWITFGGKAVRVYSAGGPELCTISGGYEGRVIQFVNGEGPGAILEGITITGGSGFDPGEGIYISSASPTIRNCRIFDNGIAVGNGGGVYCANSSPVFENCRIQGNGAGYYQALGGNGGGLYADDASRPVLQDCIISGNEVLRGSGAGIYCSDASLVRCTVTGNSTEQGVDGGGIRCGPADLIDCTFTNNYSRSGGGICAYGASISGCTVTGNRVDESGGGIYARNTSIVGCVIAGNGPGPYSTPMLGGGVSGVDLQITDCVITGNRGLQGGAIDCMNSTVTGCTVSGNTTSCEPSYPHGHAVTASNTSIMRTILWGNCCMEDGSPGDLTSNGGVSLTCCDVRMAGVQGPVTYIGPQVTTDPLFCAPLLCSDAPVVGGDYSLADSSPCLPGASPCGQLIGALPRGCPDPMDVPEPAGPFSPPPTSLSLTIRPNPTGGTIRYEFGLPRESAVRARLFDAGGRLVRSSGERTYARGVHEGDFPAGRGADPALPAGVYYLRLDTEEGSRTETLILIR